MNRPKVQRDSTKQLPQPCSASACGKAILVGEHAVVYGSRALALPLRDMRLDLTLTPGQPGRSPSVTMKAGDLQMTQRVADVFVEAAEILGLEAFPVEIIGGSALPIGAGVGSSAALCVGALRGVARSMGLSLPPDRLAGLANSLEKRFHGNPSGLDTAVVAFESCLLFKRGATIEPVTGLPFGKWHFALVDSGVRASTMSMINLASPKFKGLEGEKRLRHFDDLAEVASAALRDGDQSTMAQAIQSCAGLLDELGIVSDLLHSIIQHCLGIGCLAAKTTGAGGGGVVLCLLDETKPLAMIEQLIQHFGPSRVFHVLV